MNAVFQAAHDLQEFVRWCGWPFCMIGGIVVSRWGVERMTQDADMTVLTRIERDDECIEKLTGKFLLWFPNSVEIARHSRILFLKHTNGVRMDVALGTMDFEERAIERGSWWDSGEGLKLFTCSAEDLIVHKAFAARDRDWADIDSVLSVQGKRLNVPQIIRELEPLTLLKEDGGIIPKLEHLLKKRGLV